MAVRVKVEVEFKNKKIKAVGIANAGYETDEPEILLPGRLFKKYWKEKGKDIRYVTAGEQITIFKEVGRCKVKVITKDKTSDEVITKLIVSDKEKEVLLSDALIEELKMILLKVKEGRWCFRGESIERESEPVERW